MYGVKSIKELNNEYIKKLRCHIKDTTNILNLIQTLLKGNNMLSNELKLKNIKFISNESNLSFNFISNLSYIQLLKLYFIVKDYQNNIILEFNKKKINIYTTMIFLLLIN